MRKIPYIKFKESGLSCGEIIYIDGINSAVHVRFPSSSVLHNISWNQFLTMHTLEIVTDLTCRDEPIKDLLEELDKWRGQLFDSQLNVIESILRQN